MFWNLKSIVYSLLLILVTILVSNAYAQTLVDNSPFIPFDYVSGPVEMPIMPSRAGVELRGILDFGDEPKFSLYNTRTQQSVWVDFKDKGAPYYIDSYDPQKKLVAITINGVRQQLKVSKPSDDTVGAGAASRGVAHVPGTAPTNNKLEEEDDDEEDEDDEDDDEETPEEDMARKRKEMSEKVYKAFQNYVSGKRGEESPSSQ